MDIMRGDMCGEHGKETRKSWPSIVTKKRMRGKGQRHNKLETIRPLLDKKKQITSWQNDMYSVNYLLNIPSYFLFANVSLL